MKKYKHLTSGEVVEVVESNDKTVTIKLPNGETRELGAITLKRWWKPFEDENAKTSEDVPTSPEMGQIELKDVETDKTTPEEENAIEDEIDAQNEVPENETTESETLETSEGAPTSPETTQIELERTETDKTTPEEENAIEDEIDAQNETPEDAPQVMELSAIVKKLEDCFDLLNGLYFDNQLPRPVITIQSTPKAYGHCSTKKIWNSGEEDGAGQYEINIGAEYLNRASENTAATLCHEMVHLYCRENEISETCQNGRYHTKVFRDNMAACDLEVEYSRSSGYSSTIVTRAFTDRLKDAGFELEIPFARHTLGKGEKVANRAKARVYKCPECGQTVKSTAELNLICGDCNVALERGE